MKELYIKFKEGDEDSLREAINEAEKLEYDRWDNKNAIRFEGFGLLACDKEGFYCTTEFSEQTLIGYGYQEHIITNQTTMKYKQGDILIDSDGYKIKVLGICGEVYSMSRINEFTHYCGGYTQYELDHNGYKLKTEEETPREVTMKEVIEKFGENVIIKK